MTKATLLARLLAETDREKRAKKTMILMVWDWLTDEQRLTLAIELN